MPTPSPRIAWHRKSSHVSARNKRFRCETTRAEACLRSSAGSAGAIPPFQLMRVAEAPPRAPPGHPTGRGAARRRERQYRSRQGAVLPSDHAHGLRGTPERRAVAIVRGTVRVLGVCRAAPPAGLPGRGHLVQLPDVEGSAAAGPLCLRAGHQDGIPGGVGRARRVPSESRVPCRPGGPDWLAPRVLAALDDPLPRRRRELPGSSGRRCEALLGGAAL